MEIKYTQTEKAPAAIGPYSQAVSVGNLLFTSGQNPIDPATGEIAGATIEEQARQSVANVGAILEANLLPPPEPKESWRRIMDELSVISCDLYRGYVRENKDFVPYFRSATPEQELGKLPLGSRPAKRRPTGGVESLRAIPWIFAWTQNRLMLPAWLGAGTALQKVVEDGKQSELEAMCRDWPFFSTRLGMLEMVFAKADLWLAEYYDQRLVDKALWPLGKELRNLQEEDIKVVLAIANDSHLMADLPWIAESIQLRNIYTDPLNVLQAELLHRHPPWLF